MSTHHGVKAIISTWGDDLAHHTCVLWSLNTANCGSLPAFIQIKILWSSHHDIFINGYSLIYYNKLSLPLSTINYVRLWSQNYIKGQFIKKLSGLDMVETEHSNTPISIPMPAPRQVIKLAGPLDQARRFGQWLRTLRECRSPVWLVFQRDQCFSTVDV